MAHPFEKFFDKALKTSTELDNQVLVEAEKLLEKGYPGAEIAGILLRLERGLIDPAEAAMVKEALEEFQHYLEE